jgi:hypothetical protein
VALAACGSSGTKHASLDDGAFAAAGSTGSGGNGAAGASTGTGGGAGATLMVTRSLVVSQPSSGLYESEPHLARGPNGELAAVFIVLAGTRSIAVTTSLDDGGSWSPPVALLAPDGRDGVDPSVTFDAAGGLSVAFLGLRYDAAGNKSDRVILVARAPSASAPFATPSIVSSPGSAADLDKPWIVSLDDGASVISWTTDTGSPVTVARSDDATTWKSTSIAPDGQLRAVAFPCAASAASVHVTYLTPSGVYLATSSDGGRTFPASTAAKVSGTDAVAFDPPSCVASGDRVWVTYGLLGEAGGVLVADQSSEIRVAASIDGGKTFGASRRAAGPGAFLHPQIARDEKGRLAVAFDAKGDASKAWVRVAVSTDDGATFSAAGDLAGPMAFDRSRTDLSWLGDYLGLTMEGDTLRAAIVDNAATPGASVSRVRFVAARWE